MKIYIYTFQNAYRDDDHRNSADTAACTCCVPVRTVAINFRKYSQNDKRLQDYRKYIGYSPLTATVLGTTYPVVGGNIVARQQLVCFVKHIQIF